MCSNSGADIALNKPNEYVCFDPRDPAQMEDDRSTWRLSRNPILILATLHFESQARKTPMDWEKVSLLAEFCSDFSIDGPEMRTPVGLAFARFAVETT